jgi:hypothetical protein
VHITESCRYETQSKQAFVFNFKDHCPCKSKMAKVLESLIAKGRRARRPPEQKEVAFGLADLSTHGMKARPNLGCD